MHRKTLTLARLKSGKTGKIIHIQGGHGFQRRLQVMGVREGQTVKIVTKQPLMGPITVSIGNSQMTIGRGMAHKIIVEEI